MNYRTAQTADLPAMMKMVEEAKEGFRARNIDQWQRRTKRTGAYRRH